ncbi:hypothetical protein ANANG_G00320070, partial [Anguilla anguilla]
ERSAGLEDPQCKVQRLGLSGCKVTQRGCDSLASALCSNPSHLRELDLRYNHPGDSGVRALSAAKLTHSHCCKYREFPQCTSHTHTHTHLRELDLRHNHPGDSGVRALSAAKLDTLTLLVDHG